MRKLLTLTLAVALVLSLASVAFAATYTVTDTLYKQSDGKVDAAVTKVGYGDSVFLKTGVTTYDLAKDLKVKATWSENGDRVASVGLVKKALTAGGSEYFIEIATKKDTTLASNNIDGKLELSTKTGKSIELNGNGGTGTKETVTIFFTLGYDSTMSQQLDKTNKIYKFAATAASDKFAYDEEFELSLYGFETGNATFVVDTTGQGNILVGNTVQYNEGLEAIFGDDNYVYINGNGAAFNRTGVLTLPAEAGQQLYSIKANGKLEPAKNAEYDEVEEAFIVKTRVLGKYVIADKEYETKVVTPEAPVEEAPVNPGTGAAA